MSTLTWGDAKEIVEISLELGRTNKEMVEDLRGREGTDLITAIYRVFSLLAVADHPLAEGRYQSMRVHFTRLNTSPPWMTARLRLRATMPLKDRL